MHDHECEHVQKYMNIVRLDLNSRLGFSWLRPRSKSSSSLGFTFSLAAAALVAAASGSELESSLLFL